MPFYQLTENCVLNPELTNACNGIMLTVKTMLI